MDIEGPIDTSQAGLGSGSRMGGGRGVAVGGGGLGVVGLIVYLLVNVLGGGNGSTSGITTGFGDAPAAGTAGQQATTLSCPAGSAKTDVRCKLTGVVNDVQRVWTAKFAAAGKTYEPTRIIFFPGAISTGCGDATAAAGPFYCPADQLVYLDVSFLDDLKSKYGAPGEFAQAYVVAHEIGHHVQHLLGIDAQVQKAVSADSSRASDLSVRTELQADCFAGAWAHDTVNDAQNGTTANVTLDPGDIQAALEAAGAIGDDTLEKQAGMQVNPDTFTHGTSAQRVKWFTTGSQTGSVSSCDTFSGTP